MHIGLYFGSFNPIHTGHLIIANHIRQQVELNQVWFIVSPQNPLKPSSALLNEFHRLALVQLAIDDEPGLKASDIEFRLPRPSYTADTLAYLQDKYPQHEFSIIMGSDSFQNLSKWKNPEYILKHHKIYVYKRPGIDIKPQPDNSNVIVLDAPLLQISATHIRENVRNGRSIRFLVPDKVKEEIERNGYYR
ncbi:MAG TPA: nicotinate (nicotinamide) nucleotide adenylyltransferase [Chitinophagaceae bacterium]|nr:nicotinate (nicotinamide) nucleotide adenylyltransferase [Chitinophagaceae bacterium]